MQDQRLLHGEHLREGCSSSRSIILLRHDATFALARAAAALTKAGKLTSVAGGGDTVAALNTAGVTGSFTYVSTAGGAFLEWLEGKELPGVEALKRAA